jgi:hypothetical membrane protein
MNLRQVGFLGIAAWVVFWSASFVFAAFRPSYSHVVNTISELGAVGTPHATAWNIILLRLVRCSVAESYQA